MQGEESGGAAVNLAGWDTCVACAGRGDGSIGLTGSGTQKKGRVRE